MEELYTTSRVDVTSIPQEYLNKDTVDVLYPLGPDTIVRSQASDAKLLNILASNAAFGVHEDMRSHSCATMTLGKGMVISGSIKQKLILEVRPN